MRLTGQDGRIKIRRRDYQLKFAIPAAIAAIISPTNDIAPRCGSARRFEGIGKPPVASITLWDPSKSFSPA